MLEVLYIETSAEWFRERLMLIVKVKTFRKFQLSSQIIDKRTSFVQKINTIDTSYLDVFC